MMLMLISYPNLCSFYHHLITASTSIRRLTFLDQPVDFNQFHKLLDKNGNSSTKYSGNLFYTE